MNNSVQRVIILVVNVEGEMEIVSQGDIDYDALTEVKDLFNQNVL